MSRVPLPCSMLLCTNFQVHWMSWSTLLWLFWDQRKRHLFPDKFKFATILSFWFLWGNRWWWMTTKFCRLWASFIIYWSLYHHFPQKNKSLYHQKWIIIQQNSLASNIKFSGDLIQGKVKKFLERSIARPLIWILVLLAKLALECTSPRHLSELRIIHLQIYLSPT